MLFFNRKTKKVDFLIIGAQKCGTTALFKYLNEHPNLKGAKKKEIDYFNYHYLYGLGEKWYHSNWNKFYNKGTINFSANPEDLYFRLSPERIAKYNPKMKFICLVRDPVERAFSQYMMFKHFNRTPESTEHARQVYFKNRNPEIESHFKKLFFNPTGFPSFEEFIDEEMNIIKQGLSVQEPSFIRRGVYIDQLENYYNFFPKDNFIIFEMGDLDKNTEKVLNSICEFIGVNPLEWNPDLINKKHNVKENTEMMKEVTRNKLIDFYKPYNKRFFANIGKRYNWS